MGTYAKMLITEALKLLTEKDKEIARLQALLDEWGIGGGPPIQLEAKWLTNPTCVMPGDGFHLTVKKEDGTKEELHHTITYTQRINHVSIYRFKDALGYEHATMGVFGDKKK